MRKLKPGEINHLPAVVQLIGAELESNEVKSPLEPAITSLTW
jgi:hypothetical protein